MRKRFAGSGVAGLVHGNTGRSPKHRSTRGQANKVLDEYRHAHNKRFAVAPQDTQPAWRQAPSDHTQLLDLCALHYVRKVYKNHTVRLDGRVIDIPKRPDAARATYAGKEVVVKHLLSGDYRVFYGEECIAWASGSRPKPSTSSNKNNDTDEQLGDIFTEQLRGDIFTWL